MSETSSATRSSSEAAPFGSPVGRRLRYRPRLVLEIRESMPAWQQFVILALSVLCGAAISTAILVWAGVPASELLSEFVNTVVDEQSIRAVLTQAAPLILVGIAASVAFQARFWNLGIEGQMVFGSIAATAVSLWHVGPDSLRLLLMACAAVLGGLIWSVIPALLKLWLSVNEIIVTLLLNYVATYFLYDLLYGVWKDPTDGFPHSQVYGSGERLPDIAWSINAALPVSLALMLVVVWLTQISRFGVYLRFIHANVAMAMRVGVPVVTTTFGAVFLSGSLAGVAGFVVSSGMEGRLSQGFFEGYGFSGVLIAFLARNNSLVAPLVAVLVAMLFVTGQTLQIFYQIPFSMVQLIQAIIVMCVAATEFFIRHRINLRG
jgi:ABC-type uncharacterized transport system permease subunit